MSKGLWQPGDIVYASPTRMYTEREVIYREREAFENGLIRGTAREFDGPGGGMAALKRAVERAFPLPKVTRLRDVTIRLANGTRFRACSAHGQLLDAVERKPIEKINVEEFGPNGLRQVADLLANPTEEVEAE